MQGFFPFFQRLARHRISSVRCSQLLTVSPATAPEGPSEVAAGSSHVVKVGLYPVGVDSGRMMFVWEVLLECSLQPREASPTPSTHLVIRNGQRMESHELPVFCLSTGPQMSMV
jgi:hypothetical protein